MSNELFKIFEYLFKHTVYEEGALSQ